MPVAIVQLIGQLAWSIVLLVIVFRFRSQIESLLTKIAPPLCKQRSTILLLNCSATRTVYERPRRLVGFT